MGAEPEHAQSTCCDYVAVGGGSSVRVLDLTRAEIRDIQAESVELPIGQSVHKVGWSPDGQLLTVSTTVSPSLLFAALSCLSAMQCMCAVITAVHCLL